MVGVRVMEIAFKGPPLGNKELLSADDLQVRRRPYSSSEKPRIHLPQAQQLRVRPTQRVRCRLIFIDERPSKVLFHVLRLRVESSWVKAPVTEAIFCCLQDLDTCYIYTRY